MQKGEQLCLDKHRTTMEAYSQGFQWQSAFSGRVSRQFVTVAARNRRRRRDALGIMRKSCRSPCPYSYTNEVWCCFGFVLAPVLAAHTHTGCENFAKLEFQFLGRNTIGRWIRTGEWINFNEWLNSDFCIEQLGTQLALSHASIF